MAENKKIPTSAATPNPAPTPAPTPAATPNPAPTLEALAKTMVTELLLGIERILSDFKKDIMAPNVEQDTPVVNKVYELKKKEVKRKKQ
jgi:hypothetical protein